MRSIIVSDIFGKTTALVKLARELDADAIIDPYNGKNMNFSSEVQAYEYFTQNVGIESYLEKLLKIVKESTSECTLIGFSIGASIIWKLSDKALSPHNQKVKKAICYYGSQIRLSTEVSPIFKISIIFPKWEPHFEVTAIKKILDKKDNVTTKHVNFLHGFMNIHSSNFERIAYYEHMKYLEKEIKNIS